MRFYIQDNSPKNLKDPLFLHDFDGGSLGFHGYRFTKTIAIAWPFNEKTHAEKRLQSLKAAMSEEEAKYLRVVRYLRGKIVPVTS